MSPARPSRRVKRTAVKAEPRPVRYPSSPSPPSRTPGSQLPITKAAFFGKAIWVSLALIAANLVVYAPVRHYDFVNFDDLYYVIENPHVTAGLTWSGVWWAFTTGAVSNWHPLTWLSHMLDVQLFGMNAGAHHLTNVLLHIANSILLFGLLHRMTGALGRSTFVAGLFAVHPIHVESVAWVAERKDVLSTLFWLLTLWAYVGYVQQPRWQRYLAVLALFALGLMAKPMLVTLPMTLLLLDFWPLRRVTVGGDTAGLGWATFWKQRAVTLRLVWEKVPLFFLTILSSVVTFVVQQRGGAIKELQAIPSKLRLENALVSYVAYIGKTLWPTRLAALYPYSLSLPGWWVLGSLLGLIGVSVLVIRAAPHRPYLLVGWLWYLGTLVPVIGLVQVGDQAMADRYTYVPLIGLFLIAAWGIPDLLARWRYRRIVLPAAAGLVMAVCMIMARVQVQHWKNTLALWQYTLEVTTENYVAHYNLGVALSDQGKISEAIPHYAAAVRIKPSHTLAHNNLGLALVNQGRLDEAVVHFTEALRIEPHHALAHNNLGLALAKQGRFREAIAHYSEALRAQPDFAEAHYNLGLALVDQGKLGEAMAHYAEALRIKPNFADAHNHLGVALGNQGRFEEAAIHYSEALRLQPANAEAHNNLGVALANQGKFNDAIVHYTEALRIKPRFDLAHINLGIALAMQGRLSDAIAHFSDALRINPGNPLAQRWIDDLRNHRKTAQPRTQ
ncbi:MAG: tetratricopeptide repeat protein [Acidobacteria bacterium]|nr:tetratricopeptide repeat protein [Acidobacteriota bacterium]